MNKTENTPENKAAFFAHYYGQGVMLSQYSAIINNSPLDPAWAIRASTLEKWPTVDNSILLLKPLSQITDEDAIEVAKICSHYFPINEDVECEVFINSFGRKVVSWGKSYKEKFLVEHAKDTAQGADFLRSKGYLLPWRDLSVEEIISYGWAKYEA